MFSMKVLLTSYMLVLTYWSKYFLMWCQLYMLVSVSYVFEQL